MKYLKILGLAAVAAAALMAFAGAGTAAADELCESNVSDCAGGGRITKIEASQVGTGRLKTTGGSTLASCTGASLTMSNIDQGTGVSPVVVTKNEIGWSGCSTTVDTVSGGTGTGSSAGSNTTTLTSINGQVTLNLFGISCIYSTGAGGTDLGVVNTKGELPTFNVTVNKTSGGGLCPETGKWEAAFKSTKPTSIFYESN